MIIKLSAEDTVVTVNKKHLNKLFFTATIAYIDEPSDKAPCGANGKLLVLRRDAVEKALETMNLMAINCSASSGFKEHNPREKVGLVERSFIEGNALRCSGFFYAHDYPDIAYVIKNAVDTMGFSIEASIINCEQDDKNVYVTEMVFTGLSAVFAESAAFTKTHIDYLAASSANKENKDGNKMELKDIQELMASMQESMLGSVKEIVGAMQVKMSASAEKSKADMEALTAQIAELKASSAVVAEVVVPAVDAVTASASAVVAPYVAQVQAQVDPTVIPAPTTVQASVENPAVAPVDKTAKIKEINASATMSMQEKLREITKVRLAESK